nr:MAG TPA: hypothetical protein [Caudoviricetes sp.]
MTRATRKDLHVHATQCIVVDIRRNKPLKINPKKRR